ncbi:hypothetical protein BD560DRAFT_397421 [Blakeslea trispora]|nr:hypothetical protein BD560DRAFT_397421 [Blakeslea trispora]
MTTLGDFGFVKGRKHPSVDSKQLDNRAHAFISPVSLPTKTENIPKKKSTLQHYFPPKPQLDTPSDENTIICVVRKKQSICSLWESILSECEQQDLFQTMTKQNKKKKRSCPTDVYRPIKRSKRSYQHEMSSIMHQFVRLNTHATIKPVSSSFIDLLQEYQPEEEEENLSRQVKGRMSTEASHLYVAQIAQEFLCL